MADQNINIEKIIGHNAGDSLLSQAEKNKLTNATTQGNTFNGSGQLVQMTDDNKLPAVDGSLLTNLPSSGITTANQIIVPWTAYQGNNIQTIFTNGTAGGADPLIGLPFASEIQLYVNADANSACFVKNSGAINSGRGSVDFTQFNKVNVKQKINIPTLGTAANLGSACSLMFGLFRIFTMGTIPSDGLFTQIDGATLSFVKRVSSVSTFHATTFTVVANTVYDVEIEWDRVNATSTLTIGGIVIATFTGLPSFSSLDRGVASLYGLRESIAGTSNFLVKFGLGSFTGTLN